jgi:hypothetical protein
MYRKFAGDFADRYIEDYMVAHLRKAMKVESEDLDDLRDALEDPRLCLKAFFGHYAFARRGKDRDDLAAAALSSLDKVQGDHEFSDVLQMEDGVAVWESFLKECESRKRKPNENQNRGMLQGMLELAQEIYAIDKVGSIASWVCNGIEQTGHLEPQFLRIVDIRGVGPKSTSTFIRDVVFLFDVEESVEPADKIYVQPVDRWLRAIVKYAVPEPNMEDAADWIVAGKISKYARRARVSSIRFNMGVTYFGQKIVKEPDRFSDEMKSLMIDLMQKPNA